MAIVKRNSLWIREQMSKFDTFIGIFVDVDGFYSYMKWIPPFTACRALTDNAKVATPSGTVGDFFHPEQIQTGWTENTDYEVLGKRLRLTSGALTVGRHYRIEELKADDDFTNVGAPQNASGQCFIATGDTPTHWEHSSVLWENEMGGYWVDMYLCSSSNATMIAAGDVCNGSDTGRKCYISQPLKVPRVAQTIAHFRQYLKSRFDKGGFLHLGQGAAYEGWAGKGGLMTDAHWNELWLWTRINRWLLRGNTNGYNASNHIPQWHLDPNDIGLKDPTLDAAWGGSLAGGGSKLWEIPVSDFCGNRWEFADGLRLNANGIYTALKTVNPFTDPTDGYGHASFVDTGLTVDGVTSGQSVASLRTENLLKKHGIPASTVPSGQGGFDGQGFWYVATDERISLRGGNCDSGARCPGALALINAPSDYAWYIGARAVLVP
ncbi:MAG TPA: hypothetical protein DDW17_02210 [Deltaproteobacteria bacterium]|nr:hypothetical protein [Deltaproteobacteria bacterium]